MKLTRKALALGFAVAAVSAAACSSQHGSTVGTAGGGGSSPVVLGSNGGNTGSVGMHLNIGTSGFTISSLNWTIANGSNSYQGTINMTDDAGNAAQSIEFVAGPVVAGSNYTVTLTGSDSNGDPCTGTSPPFAVSAGTSTTAQAAVNVVCTVPADASLSQTVDSGSVAVDAGVSVVNQAAFQCPGITGVAISPAEVHPPQVANLNGGVFLAANPGGTETLLWSTDCGGASIDNSGSAMATFHCGTNVNQDCHVTLTVGLNGTGADGGTVGQVCTGVANTSITETIHCENGGIVLPACPTGQTQCGTTVSDCEDLQGGTVGNHNCGACGAPACSGATPTCQNGVCVAPPPVPCVNAATDAPNCVKCEGNTNGLCTPSEAIIVARDISKGNLSAGQESGSNGCYECLWNAGCIDDTLNPDTGKECGDLTGNVGAGAQAGETKTQACLNTLNCIFPSDCQNAKATSGSTATDGISNCFCGPLYPNTTVCSAAASGTPNGACYQTELDGLGDTSSTSISTVLGAFTTRTTGAGMANAIFQCAGSNAASFTCPTCF